MVNEEDTVEMIILMLKDPRLQPLQLLFHRLKSKVLIFHINLIRSLKFTEYPGDAETSLVKGHLFLFNLNNLRIKKNLLHRFEIRITSMHRRGINNKYLF